MTYYTEVKLFRIIGTMQTGPYIAERLMPQTIAAYCQEMGIDFQAFSDEWVLRLGKNAICRWVVGYRFDLNQSAASELAQDKVASYAALTASDIVAVPHYLVRSLPHELIHVANLHSLLDGQSVVVKPLDGTGGRAVERFETLSQALQMIRGVDEPAWAVSPYYDLRAEYRLIMLDNEALLIYEKTQPTYRGNLKLFNLGHGAIAKEVADDILRTQLITIAQRVMRAMSLRLAAVDIVRMADGALWVMEVNDGICMEHYARQSVPCKERAAGIYEAIIGAMFTDSDVPSS